MTSLDEQHFLIDNPYGHVMCSRHVTGQLCPDRQSRIKRESCAVYVHGHLRYRHGMEPSLHGDSPCVYHRDEVTTPERDWGYFLIHPMQYADW